jgi:predicted nicotinamide N-methyase
MPDTMRIADFDARRTTIEVDDERIALWQVADLAPHVDRTALLAGDDPPEPPYWAHLWSGAVVLAAAVPSVTRALELGCGLGLVGMVAARRGARVTFLDRIPTALAFVRASARANGLRDVDLVAADATRPPLTATFDLVLAAELLYDRASFAPLARTLACVSAQTGRVLLTDAGRTDTSGFYAALAAAGFCWRAREHVVREERLPVRVRLVEAVRPGTPFLVVAPDDD